MLKKIKIKNLLLSPSLKFNLETFRSAKQVAMCTCWRVMAKILFSGTT